MNVMCSQKSPVHHLVLNNVFLNVWCIERSIEICFLFYLYYTLNLDRSLPAEFTNVKQPAILFYFLSKTLLQIYSTNYIFMVDIFFENTLK